MTTRQVDRDRTNSVPGTLALGLLWALAVGCGSADDGKTLGPGAARTAGVVVQVFWVGGDTTQEDWVLVDTVDGTEIDGSTHLALRIDPTELGCGEQGRPIDLLHLKAGTDVTFELTDIPAGHVPFPPDGSGQVPVGVTARQLRMACPASAADVAATLAAQRARWAAAGLDTYEFTISFQVFGPAAGDYRVSVVDGQPAGTRRIDGATVDMNGGAVERWLSDIPNSIEAVFDVIERNVDADQIDIVYDPTLGYPTSVQIDPDLNSVDEETGIRIYHLTPGTTATATATSGS